MNAILLLITQVTSSYSGYIIGIVIAVFILGYLIYSLVKPENF